MGSMDLPYDFIGKKKNIRRVALLDFKRDTPIDSPSWFQITRTWEDMKMKMQWVLNLIRSSWNALLKAVPFVNLVPPQVEMPFKAKDIRISYI